MKTLEENRTLKDTLLKSTGIRTFQVLQYVTGPLPGGVDDWPANIQDVIYRALDIKSAQVELPLTVVHSFCDKDHDRDPAKEPVFFLCVIASEIVTAIQ